MPNCRYSRKIGLLCSRIIAWYRHRLGWIPTVFWIIGLALIVRLPDLTVPLWYDEIFSARVATLPLNRLMEAVAGDVHPVGYYLLLKAVVLTLGQSEFVLRLPSLLAGLALIWLVYRLAGAIGFTTGQQTASALMVALSPFQVYYAQEARAYAIVMAALTLAALGLVEKRRWWFIIGCAGALYLNTMSLFVVIGLGLAGLWIDRTKRFFACVAAIGLLYIPAGLTVAGQAHTISGNYWILPPFSPGRLIAVADDLLFFSPQTTMVFASAMLTTIAIVLICRSVNLPMLVSRPALYLLLSAGPVPLCLAAIVSVLWTPVLISRSMAGSAPFLYLLMVWAVSRERRSARWWFTGAAVVATAIIIGGTATNRMGRVDWTIENHPEPGEAVYHSSLTTFLPYQYYWPGQEHYLLPSDHGLNNDLSAQTKKALSIDSAEKPLDEIICRTPSDVWRLALTLTTLNTPADEAAILALQRQYERNRTDTTENEASQSRVYVVNCPGLTETTTPHAIFPTASIAPQ
jgi:hypothetical protein